MVQLMLERFESGKHMAFDSLLRNIKVLCNFFAAKILHATELKYFAGFWRQLGNGAIDMCIDFFGANQMIGGYTRVLGKSMEAIDIFLLNFLMSNTVQSFVSYGCKEISRKGSVVVNLTPLFPNCEKNLL